ncbi:Tsr2p [Sugiyamaella lignohabitans]|uniref:Tsr2p n=1 Tax=Sugiyamaella lignohabitans TaxID=796027 RepID=A0A167BZD0_9ASCO|nr:Tsr2p [Sugiyamaella lignohabitans]ANB11013.1 Tsr2p [Sugiyamaella lignohabitans]
MSEPLASVQGEGANLVLSDPKHQSRFELGVCMAVYQWDNLQTAVDNQWGGADSEDKRDWMVGSVVELFETSNYVDSDDIEDRLLGIMEDEFGVSIEDNTATPVAVSIIQLYKECAEGNFSHVDELYAKYQEKESKRKAGLLPVNKVQTEGSDEEDEDEEEGDDDEEMNDAPASSSSSDPSEPQGPIVDEDGFELVQKKGNRRR